MENIMGKTAAAPQIDKIMKDTADFSSGYSEACSKSGAILMKGMEDIIETMVSLAQSSAEKHAEFMKEVMSVKNVNEFAEIQSKIAQSSFDDFINGATKISEIGVKVLTDSAEPVNAQITQAVQKATKSMAA